MYMCKIEIITEIQCTCRQQTGNCMSVSNSHWSMSRERLECIVVIYEFLF